MVLLLKKNDNFPLMVIPVYLQERKTGSSIVIVTMLQYYGRDIL